MIMVDKADVLYNIPNFAVVKLKGRNFPGVVIQGDSLSILRNLSKDILDEISIKEGKDSELYHMALELFEGLDGRLNYYEQILKKNKIDIPYSKK